MAGRKRKNGNAPFSKVLKALMIERGLKLADVAEMAGVTTSVVSDWVNGATPSDMLIAKKLSDALKVPFQYLMLGLKEESPLQATQPSSFLSNLFAQGEVVEGVFKISVQRLMPIESQIQVKKDNE